ncbi:MAG: hypothetical protein ACR2PG_12525 [Hyphomicrobiaceae bacterium]
MTTDTAHTSEDNAELRQLLAQRDAEIARQSTELQARDRRSNCGEFLGTNKRDFGRVHTA